MYPFFITFKLVPLMVFARRIISSYFQSTLQNVYQKNRIIYDTVPHNKISGYYCNIFNKNDRGT